MTSARWTLVAMTVGCTAAPASKDSGKATEEVDVDINPGTPDLPDSDKGEVTGVLAGSDGTPLEGASVNLCNAVCVHDSTDADGYFSIYADDGMWSLKVDVEPTDPASGWSSPLVPVPVLAEGTYSLGSIPVPRLDALIPLTEAGAIELTPGLTVTADPDDWEPPVLTPSAEPWLGAASYDFAATVLPHHGLYGTVLTAWTLAPAGMHPASPWPVTLANPGLEAGTTAEVWVSDYDTQSWVFAGTVTPSEDGTLLEGAELTTLGMVLLFQPAD